MWGVGWGGCWGGGVPGVGSRGVKEDLPMSTATIPTGVVNQEVRGTPVCLWL